MRRGADTGVRPYSDGVPGLEPFVSSRLRLAIAVEVPREELPLPVVKLRADVARAAAEAGFAGSLSVAVVSDAEMRRVNREFHDCDEATDVLAFALGGSGPHGFDAEVVVSL